MAQGVLSSVDWTFENNSRQSALHRLHPYPAKFISEIPANLLDILHPKKLSTVLDPFCGSGTVLVESIDRGLNAIGIDLNPLATLITRVKTSPLPLNFLRVGKSVLASALKKYARGDFEVPQIPRIDHWFKTEVPQDRLNDK